MPQTTGEGSVWISVAFMQTAAKSIWANGSPRLRFIPRKDRSEFVPSHLPHRGQDHRFQSHGNIVSVATKAGAAEDRPSAHHTLSNVDDCAGQVLQAKGKAGGYIASTITRWRPWWLELATHSSEARMGHTET
jgi:hypothetical protein